MKKLYYLFLPVFICLCLNVSAADKKKKDKPYVKSYHYLRVREPVRVNVVKFDPSPQDTLITGLKISGYNVGDAGTLDGCELGFFSACAKLKGFQFGLFSCLADDLSGLQVGLFHNHAKKFAGVQFSIVNRADKHPGGWQFGIVNFSKKDGIQFGLLNFKKDGFLPIFPLINF
jgi:hypothetical protein